MSQFTRFFDFLRPGKRNRLMQGLAKEVAGSCRADVVDRVYTQTNVMSPAEVRGYVRAHASCFVAVAADGTARHHRLRNQARRQLVAEATDLLVLMAVCDLSKAESPRQLWARAA